MFAGLKGDRIAQLANEFRVVHLDAGERLYSEGDATDFFFVVWNGRIRLGAATLIFGDYFGENMLIEKTHKEAAFALGATTVLALWKGQLFRLLGEQPNIRDILMTRAKERQLARSSRIATFLKSMALFDELDDERIARLADEFQLVDLNPGQRLYVEGDPARHFFIVWSGRINLTTDMDGDEGSSTLAFGDFFGEDLLVESDHKEAAITIDPTRVLKLEKQPFIELLGEFPNIKDTLMSTARKRRFASHAKIRAFLKSIALFSGLSDEHFAQLADEFQVVRLSTGQKLYAQGNPTSHFFIVWSGRIGLVTSSGDEERDTATLIAGDYFGENLLIENDHKEAAVALETAKVLKLGKQPFMALLDEFPDIKDTLIMIARSRKYARERKVSWLGKDEAVYLITRRHKFFLGVHLIPSIIILLICIPFLAMGIMSGEFASLSFVIAFVAGLIALLWMIWSWIDWGNDFYVITNQRLLWVEKVVALYDSRQEAPLDTIQSTNKVSNQTLRLFIDYGTVIVNTYTGSIVMRRAEQPDRMLGLINGLRARARDLAKQAAAEAMDTIIRRRLGVPEERKAEKEAVTAPTPPVKESQGLSRFAPNFIKVRYERGDIITYRKHWFVLFRKTWLPALVNIGLFVLASYLWVTGVFVGPIAILAWLFVLAVTGFWWAYHYVDWRNDIYVLTLENVMDIERKPFAREEKRVAPLKNILSLEHARVGIFGIIFNFGTVTINIGTEKFTFDYVYNPVHVQYEIFDRMYAYRRREEAEEAAKERERVADWLVAYHRQVERLENLENSSRTDELSG